MTNMNFHLVKSKKNSIFHSLIESDCISTVCNLKLSTQNEL